MIFLSWGKGNNFLKLILCSFECFLSFFLPLPLKASKMGLFCQYCWLDLPFTHWVNIE
jgi:hypothetical protein